MSECLVKKFYKTAGMVKYIFAWPVKSVAPWFEAT